MLFCLQHPQANAWHRIRLHKMWATPKKPYRWPTCTWKDAHYCWLLEKCNSKIQWGTTSHQSEWPSLKSLQITNAGRGVEKREPSCTVRIVNWCSHYGKHYGGSSKTNWVATQFSNHSPGIYPDKLIIWKDTHTPTFIIALFTIAKRWKKPKHPSTDKWIKKMRYMHAMEYYSAIKGMKWCHLQQYGWT